MLEWISEHRAMLAWTGGLSAALLVAGMIAGPILIVRLPADYLVRDERRRGGASIARNIVGWLLVIGGSAMLVLPGPGVIVLLVGIVMVDFPGKRRVVRWIVSRGSILRSANRLRRRHGRPPLKDPNASREGRE